MLCKRSEKHQVLSELRKGAGIGITPGKKTKLLRLALLRLLLAALKKKVFKIMLQMRERVVNTLPTDRTF